MNLLNENDFKIYYENLAKVLISEGIERGEAIDQAFVLATKERNDLKSLQKNSETAYPLTPGKNVNSDKTFAQWKGNKDSLFNLASNYCESFEDRIEDGLGFILSGKPGIGKTYALACIANKLLSESYRVVFINHQALLSRIRSTFDKNNFESEGTIFDHISKADLVILDELGVGRPTDWLIEKTYEIVDMLYREGTPLLGATNLTDVQLREYFCDPNTGQERISERLFERSPLRKVTGENHRVSKRKQSQSVIDELAGSEKTLV